MVKWVARDSKEARVGLRRGRREVLDLRAASVSLTSPVEGEEEVLSKEAATVSLHEGELFFARGPFVLGARIDADASNSLRTFVEMSTRLESETPSLFFVDIEDSDDEREEETATVPSSALGTLSTKIETALANVSAIATSPTFLTERARLLGVLVEAGEGSGGGEEMLAAADRGDATVTCSVEGRPFPTTCLRMSARTRSLMIAGDVEDDVTGSDGTLEWAREE